MPRIKTQPEVMQGCGSCSPLGGEVTQPPFSVVFVLEWQCVAHALRQRHHSPSPEVNVVSIKITWQLLCIDLFSPIHLSSI